MAEMPYMSALLKQNSIKLMSSFAHLESNKEENRGLAAI